MKAHQVTPHAVGEIVQICGEESTIVSVLGSLSVGAAEVVVFNGAAEVVGFKSSSCCLAV